MQDLTNIPPLPRWPVWKWVGVATLVLAACPLLFLWSVYDAIRDPDALD